MKVGMITLGRMGEDIARRMMQDEISVFSYQQNYELSSEQYDAGYISGCTTSIPLLVDQIKKKMVYGVKSGESVLFEESGIFMLCIPPENVEHTLDQLLPLMVEGDVLIDLSSSDAKACQELELYCSKLGIAYIYSNVFGSRVAIDTCRKIFRSLAP
jgi:6-phosphogluconate dehydrogenase|tara:strand:- start:1587 stop:2057 length:471 start_codon:yes stop_codon:yes gene_type:complete